jgi:UDP-N-acetylmuramoyl-tripeptide--D-alanyl-D-alanine ligase
VGKTTTKEILAALLGAKLRVLKSEGNFNNAYGLPLTLFRLEDEHAAVEERVPSRLDNKIATATAIRNINVPHAVASLRSRCPRLHPVGLGEACGGC